MMFWAWTYDPKIKWKNKIINFLIKNLLNIAFAITLIVTMVNYNMAKSDFEAAYSGAKRISEYIEKEIPEGSIFVCPNNENSSAIIPYLDKKKDYKFYSPAADRFFTYVTWDKAWSRALTLKDIEARIDELYDEGYRDIYIIEKKITYFDILIELDTEKYEKIYSTDETFHTYFAEYEDYSMYKVKF